MWSRSLSRIVFSVSLVIVFLLSLSQMLVGKSYSVNALSLQSPLSTPGSATNLSRVSPLPTPQWYAPPSTYHPMPQWHVPPGYYPPTPTPYHPLASPSGLTPRAYLPLVDNNYPTPPKGLGLAYPPCEDMGAVGAAWEYAWSPNPVACPGVENVPMIKNQTDALGLINGTITLGGNSQYILGFNEPDPTWLPYQQAADLWYQIEAWRDQYHPDKKLVAPAPSTDYYDTWLLNFYNYFVATYHRPPRLDALAVHCYKTPSDCQTVIQWFETKATEWNIPDGIWVTEYGFPVGGCTTPSGCNWSSGVTALNSFTDWLKTRPLIRRYAWFTNRIVGNEKWWGNLDTTTRLIQCPTNGVVTCTPGILTPFGTAYLTK